MEGECTDARSWASMAVAKIMIEEAQRQRLPVNQLSDLGRLWRDDGSDEMAEKLWWWCFGVFDRDPFWSSRIESEYMELIGVRYITPPPPSLFLPRKKVVTR